MAYFLPLSQVTFPFFVPVQINLFPSQASTLVLPLPVPSYEVPYDLPIEQAQKYEMLLDIYMEKDLEYYRMTYGDEIIDQLYEEEFGDTGYDDDTNFNNITVLPATKNV